MTKALVCSVNTADGPYSFLQTLYGNPDDYAYKFANKTLLDKLPIHLNWVYVHHYDFFHSVSIDYETQRVYYSNHVNGRLEFGLFVHNNESKTNYLHASPKTNQVTKRLN